LSQLAARRLAAREGVFHKQIECVVMRNGARAKPIDIVMPTAEADLAFPSSAISRRAPS
jgi:hypothetical protein